MTDFSFESSHVRQHPTRENVHFTFRFLPISATRVHIEIVFRHIVNTCSVRLCRRNGTLRLFIFDEILPYFTHSNNTDSALLLLKVTQCPILLYKGGQAIMTLNINNYFILTDNVRYSNHEETKWKDYSDENFAFIFCLRKTV